WYFDSATSLPAMSFSVKFSTGGTTFFSPLSSARAPPKANRPTQTDTATQRFIRQPPERATPLKGHQVSDQVGQLVRRQRPLPDNVFRVMRLRQQLAQRLGPAVVQVRHPVEDADERRRVVTLIHVAPVIGADAVDFAVGKVIAGVAGGTASLLA